MTKLLPVVMLVAACSSVESEEVPVQPPELSEVNTGRSDERAVLLRPDTTAEEAWQICRLDRKSYRSIAGIDGTLTFMPADGTLTDEMKRQVACLQQWAKLADHHARIILEAAR